MTPEGKVKKAVRDVLAKFGDKVDGFWPVPAGYGESHLDYVGCVRSSKGVGWFLAIETKAPGKKPTPRQVMRIQNVQKAGGKVFVIDGTDKFSTVDQLEAWLMLVTA